MASSLRAVPHLRGEPSLIGAHRCPPGFEGLRRLKWRPRRAARHSQALAAGVGPLGSRDGARVNCLDIRVSSKILVVEPQDALQPVNPHRCNQARVVNLHTRNAVSDQEFPPLFVNGEALGKQAKSILKKPGAAVSLPRRKAVAISIHGTGTRIPKLRKILGRIAENALTLNNAF